MNLGDPSPAALTRTFVAAPLTLRGQEEGVVEFAGKENVPIRTNDPLSVAAMTALAEAFPAELHFDELFSRAWERSGKAGVELEARRALAGTLMELWGLDSASFSLRRSDFEKSVSDRPVAHPVGRLRASAGEDPVNALGFLFPTEEPDRKLLTLLDGTRDRDRLAQESGLSREEVERRLQAFARLALLVA